MTRKRIPPFPAEVRERAVRMVFEQEREHATQWTAICSIADKTAKRAGFRIPLPAVRPPHHPEQNAQAVDHRRRQLAHIGERALPDLAARAKALSQKHRWRRTTVRDHVDEHGGNESRRIASMQARCRLGGPPGREAIHRGGRSRHSSLASDGASGR